MGSIKQDNIKNRTYYFFDDIIIIKNLHSNLLKIDTKSCKNNYIYYIGYITMKNLDYVNNHVVNPICSIIDDLNEYIEERNGNNIQIKYLYR